MNCPNCQSSNADTSKFCLHCGYALKTTQAITPAPEQALYSKAPQQAPVTLRPAQPLHKPVSFGSTNTGLFNIWGPFAGYGTRRRHVGWLMDGQGERARDLMEKIDKLFETRKIPGTRVFQSALKARGVGVEQRHYFLLRRGLVTMGLYVAQFGRDLFVSLVSYIKPPISNFRVMVFAGMLLFQAFVSSAYPFALNTALNEAMSGVNIFGGSGPDLGMLFLLVCLVGPLGFINMLLLILLLGFSAYKWLTEKDFFAALRVPSNEFNEDDLMAMEKAVEQTVRFSLDDIGLDSSRLVPINFQEPTRLI